MRATIAWLPDPYCTFYKRGAVLHEREESVKHSAGTPMRILVISPGYNKKFEGFWYSFDKRFINGFIRNGHHVVHLSDRDLADSVLGIRQIGKIHANLKIKRVARALQPHLIAMFHASLVTNDTLADIKKETGARIANIDCDLITEKRFKRLLARKPVVDHTFITSAGPPLDWLHQAGMPASFVGNPVDPSIDIPVDPNREKIYDLVYIASAKASSPRWDLINEVERLAPELNIGKFGMGRRISGVEYYDILSSTKFALNWSAVNDLKYYSSDRIAQIIGSTTAICIPKRANYDDFLSEDSAIFFESPSDLIPEIIKNLDSYNHIAQRGYDNYMIDFSIEEISRFVTNNTL